MQNRPCRSRTQWPVVPSTPIRTNSLQSPFPTAPAPRGCRPASEIIPRVYISDLAFAENAGCLSSHGITHILSTLPDTIVIPSEAALFPQPKRLPFAELAAHLPATTAWICDALRDPEARVLVHCAEGISRSVSVVAAFLMAQYGWTPVEAIQHIKSKRRIANPNFGFVQQLHEYGRDALGRSPSC
ncbi:protein-tyrosine phosphatase-like protein [Infundibulicybe gibba]|nr:protein-tyrosine phosphatase-like protein [Infundibulicybe gibba]